MEPYRLSPKHLRPVWGFLVCGATGAALASAAAPSDEVSFRDDIRPILSNNCFQCHGPDERQRKADRRLDTADGATAELDGIRAIVPGDPDKSELIYRVTTDDEDDRMPPKKHGNKRLSKRETQLLEQWVRQGAKYERHWSYEKPIRPPVPAADGGVNAIDHFIRARLANENLDPSPEADRYALARRVALDLTGLPLSPQDVDAFVANTSPDAYEKLVDELLSRDTFGEHWARMWLDLARYADSAGYADDPPRTIWGYRDYVIRSFNANKPFDQFTVEQIAGDLLPEPSDEQLVATGFNRNTQTNNEGGTNDEEYRNVAIVDRVNTVMQTWMGTTINCAQCHSHKFDPISQKEYFQLFAVLNNTEDADRRNESPTVALFSDSQRQQKADLGSKIAALESQLGSRSPEFLTAMKKWEADTKSAAPEWHVVQPANLSTDSGATLTAGADGSILAAGNQAETDTYTLSAQPGVKGITAVRIEMLPDETLGSGGPGRNGKFVLNEFEIIAGADSAEKRGRFVRIDLPGKGKFVHLGEVQVFSGTENLAAKGVATQSGTYPGGDAKNAIDGNTDGNFAAKSTSHTAEGQADPWWEVDLGEEQDLTRIVVWNRTDNNLQNRLDGFKLSVLDADRNPVWQKAYDKAPQREVTASLDGGRTIALKNATATSEQDKFGVSKAIDGNAGGDSGWSPGDRLGVAHEAVFELAAPTSADELAEEKWQFTLKQSSAKLAIGRFRLSVTTRPQPVKVLPAEINGILVKADAERSPEELEALAKYYEAFDPATLKRRADLAALNKQLAGIKPVTTVPIMRELPAGKRRKTLIQRRGNYLDTGDEVAAGLPTAFHAPPEGMAADRLALARWLVDAENPLTARVIANRFWEKIFGIGIVVTSEEFGSQGERPTHPELLDWLAVELVESGWDIKKFLRLMVTSATYRQSSKVSAALVAADPDNRLLARGPRFRLSAEMVRDQALFAAGLLSAKMYEAPVRPPQPKLGVSAAFGGGIDWTTSAGEDKFRRGIYTTWRRSNPYPSMAAFDAPNREVCVVRRDRTNTPLQALVTLNDPVYIEAAQSLARKMNAAGDNIDAKVRHGFRRCLSRHPGDDEVARLVRLYENARAHFANNATAAKQFATMPLGAAPDGADVVDLAALTLIGNVLLNMDEVLMKR